MYLSFPYTLKFSIPAYFSINTNRDFYKVKGSKDSVEVFFRLLFDDNVEIEYPWDNTLKPSTGDWSPEINQYVSLAGLVSEKKIRIHDSNRYQRYSYLIKTGQNVSSWKNIFEKLVHPAGFIFFGEILILLNMVRDTFGDNTRSTTYTYTGRVNQFGREFFRTGRAAFNTISPSQTSLVNASLGTGDNDAGSIFQTLQAYGRDNRQTRSSMPGLQPGVIGIEDIPLLIEAFVSTFLPEAVAKVHKNAVVAIAVGTAGQTLADGSNAEGKITNKEILSKGIKEEIAIAILIKFNQVGSLTETIRAIECANSASYKSIISHRS